MLPGLSDPETVQGCPLTRSGWFQNGKDVSPFAGDRVYLSLTSAKLYSYVLSKATIRDIVSLFTNGFDDSSIFSSGTFIYPINGCLSAGEFLAGLYGYMGLPFEQNLKDVFDIEDGEGRLVTGWIFSDKRLSFSHPNSQQTIQIIEYCFHPEVRDEKSRWNDALIQINKLLHGDGLSLCVTGKISSRDLYKIQKIVFISNGMIESKEIVAKTTSEYIKKQVEQLRISCEQNSPEAIGTAKELLESAFKMILSEHKVAFSVTDSLSDLDKKTRQVLGIDKNKNNPKIPGVISILSGLSNVVNGMAELRNSYGTGHGKDESFIPLPKRYGKLAANASITYITFLLETDEDKPC